MSYNTSLYFLVPFIISLSYLFCRFFLDSTELHNVLLMMYVLMYLEKFTCQNPSWKWEVICQNPSPYWSNLAQSRLLQYWRLFIKLWCQWSIFIFSMSLILLMNFIFSQCCTYIIVMNFHQRNDFFIVMSFHHYD